MELLEGVLELATFRIEILETLGHESSMGGDYRWRVFDGEGRAQESGAAGSRAEALREASDSVERLEWSGGRRRRSNTSFWA